MKSGAFRICTASSARSRCGDVVRNDGWRGRQRSGRRQRYHTEKQRNGAGEISAESARADARLIVRRIPTLGNHVIVDLYIDGAAVLTIVYGRTYEGFIPAGRHVLSVVASPHAKWPTPTQLILNARKGKTYTFTAMGDGSGQLILSGA